jgi:thermostable 8-oxoguanine DNA glycosylase
MVDPVNCTNFSRDQYSLEEYAVFCILVANKPALRTASMLDAMLNSLPGDLPFEKLQSFTLKRMQALLKRWRFGCYTMKGKGVFQLVNKGLDLKTCSVDDLEEICGISKKTSRFFVLHSREGQKYIPLDTHILKFLWDQGIENVPASTPSSTKRYCELEAHALRFAKERNMTPADFDLSVWRHYSGNTKEVRHDADQGTPRQEVKRRHSSTSCTTSTRSPTRKREMSTLVKHVG